MEGASAIREVGSAVSGGVGCFGGAAGFGKGAKGSSSTGAGGCGAATAGGGMANGSSETGGNAGGWIGVVRAGGKIAAGVFVLLAAGAGVGIGGLSSRAVVAGDAGRTSLTGWPAGSETAVDGVEFAGSNACRGRSEAGAGAGSSRAGELAAALSAVGCGVMTGGDAEGAMSEARRGRLGEARPAAGDVSVVAGCNLAEPRSVAMLARQVRRFHRLKQPLAPYSRSTGVNGTTDGEVPTGGGGENGTASPASGGTSEGDASTGSIGGSTSHEAGTQQQRQQRRHISRQAAAGSTNKSETVVQTSATCKAFRRRFIGDFSQNSALNRNLAQDYVVVMAGPTHASVRAGKHGC